MSRAEYFRQYYIDNRDHIVEKRREWYANNRERALAQHRAYYRRNKHAAKVADVFGIGIPAARMLIETKTPAQGRGL